MNINNIQETKIITVSSYINLYKTQTEHVYENLKIGTTNE